MLSTVQIPSPKSKVCPEKRLGTLDVGQWTLFQSLKGERTRGRRQEQAAGVGSRSRRQVQVYEKQMAQKEMFACHPRLHPAPADCACLLHPASLAPAPDRLRWLLEYFRARMIRRS